MDEIPIVSVICPTYNHEKFISQALEGFLMQRTNFDFEIIVHDDASLDNTANIIKSYENKYPKYFRNIYQSENQFSKSIDIVSRITFAAARGKYIALCEGDDYWIDPLKLQKQVDYLEANPEYSLSFHNVYELENGKEPVISRLNLDQGSNSFSVLDLAKGNFIHTPSVLFRNIFGSGLPSWFAESPVGDYLVHMLVAETGKIIFFPEPMAVYRRNVGYWSGQSQLIMWEKWLVVLDLLKKHFFGQKAYSFLKMQEDQIIAQIINNCKTLFQNVENLKSNPKEIAKNVSFFNLISACRVKIVNTIKYKIL